MPRSSRSAQQVIAFAAVQGVVLAAADQLIVAAAALEDVGNAITGNHVVITGTSHVLDAGQYVAFGVTFSGCTEIFCLNNEADPLTVYICSALVPSLSTP